MRGAVVRLGLLLLLLALIGGVQELRADPGTSVALAAGALLLCGLFAGRVAGGVGLPRLTGYLLVGVAIGPYALGFLPHEGVKGLELVKGMAVMLIALVAGTELDLAVLRRVGRSVLKLGAGVSAVTFLVVGAALLLGRQWVPFLAPMSLPQAVAVSALVASVIVSFSPTVTIAIVQETEARGPFTEYLLALVVVGDLVVMLAFALSAGFVRASFGAGLDLASLLGGIGWELFGSVLVGGLAGLALLLYLKRVGEQVPLLLASLCLAGAEASARLHLSPLLVALAAGALIANLDAREAHRLHGAIQRVGLPVFALFFAAAGAGLRLSVLRDVGVLALALVALRAVALYFGCRHLTPEETPGEPPLRRFIWMGLVSQAGVTFGLAALVGRNFPGFGVEVEVLIIAMVTAHELVGPLLTRKALVGAGETAAQRKV